MNQPNLFSPPLNDPIVDDITNKEGVLETVADLNLQLSDQYIIQGLHQRIEESLKFWNEKTGFNLKQRRGYNMRMLKGDQIDANTLYHHQTPFKDNELYVGIDAKVAYITSSIADPEVYPANNEEESKLWAQDHKTYLKCYVEKFEIEAMLEDVAVDMEAQLIGILGVEWDPDYGEHGEIVTRVVNPAHCIIDKRVKRGKNPTFFCEVLTDSVDDLVAKFPKKKQEIYKAFGIQRKGQKNVNKEIAYRKVWFTFRDDKNKLQQAVCWYVNDIVLEKSKDINWLYKGEGENFLDEPMIPYIPFNSFNGGQHWIDITTSLEQAIPVQEILNIEGRQIIDNLATANGFRIVLAGVMTDDALENLTGDPNQSIIVKGKPGQSIDDVYKQIEPHLVSNELIADKNNNRDIIHSILGTPSQFRGDDADQTKTASEAQLIKNQASGRQDKTVRAFNRGLSKYFQFLTQMMAVWYTDNHVLTADGGDGAFDYVEMHQDKIKKGMTVRVYSQPSGDKARQESIAQNAAELGVLAPIDYYKMMHMDDPQKLYDNFLKYKGDPKSLALDIENNQQDDDAIRDFTALAAGKKVPQRDDITPAYLDQFRKQMISDTFLDPKSSNNKIKKAVIAFANDAMLRLALRTELDEASDAPLEQPPLPEPVQETLPPPQPMMPAGMMPPPGQPAMQPGGMPMGQPPVPQPGMPPAPPQMGAPGLPPPQMGMPPGIQGVMQQASAPPPNLSPTVQPQASVGVGSLTPR